MQLTHILFNRVRALYNRDYTIPILQKKKKGMSGSGRLNNEFQLTQLVSDSLSQTQVYLTPKPLTTRYVPLQYYKIKEENLRVLIYFTRDNSTILIFFLL